MDYEKIGLKAGLEIHQQLDTGKLFCNCPSFLRKDNPDFEIKRKLHAVAGETGEVDTAAKYESSLNKEFIYQGYKDTTCLIELDEEPPKPINQSALHEAMKIALLMNCKIYPVTQIMRKTVINGSNTSGFQRTLLLAHDGFIETSFGKIAIDALFLEEDSARPVGNKSDEEESKEENQKVYRLDRLGIPLVEIATGPHMHTPEQIKEAALKIGEILRACKVKRGIGTIRQDINVSIKGHDKVEIKGFQDPRAMNQTVEKEIIRQQEEIEKGKTTGEVRNALPDFTTEFLRPMPGKSRMYPETDLPLLKIDRQTIDSIKKQLPKVKSEIQAELKKKGLSDELMNLVLDGNLDEFETLMKVYDKDANLVAKMVTLWRSEITSKSKKSPEKVKEILTESALENILEAVAEGKIEKEDAKNVMEKLVSGIPIKKALVIEKTSDNELEESIVKIIKEKPGLRPNAYMGLVMQAHKGKIDAKKAMEIINKHCNNG